MAMKLQTKFSLVVIGMILVIMSISSVITLLRSRAMVTQAAYDYALQISKTTALDIEDRIGNYLDVCRTVAQIFGEFESTPAEARRSRFDNILYSLMFENKDFTGLWTAWLPNALDGQDARLGQYHTSYTRRNGPVELMPDGFEGWQDALKNISLDARITNPVWRQVSGYGEMPVITTIYPITKGGGSREVVGVVGLNYVSALQQLSEDACKLLYEGNSFSGVYTYDGLTVAHFDKSRIKGYIQDNPKEKALLGDKMDQVLRGIKNGEIMIFNVYSATLGTTVHAIYNPIKVKDTTTPWSMVIGMPMNVIIRDVRKLTIFTISTALAMLAVAAVIAFFMARSIVKPIIKVTLTLKDISEGEGDLTQTVVEHGKDEVADLARYFNLTLTKIRGLVGTIKKQAAVLFDIGTELASNMTQSAAAINEITANIRKVKSRVINQSASVTETNATMEQITVNIDKLNGHVENQSSSVAQSSSAIEEMLANIQSVTNTLIKNSDNVHLLMEASEVGRGGLQEVASDIQEIARESEGLLEINAVMENIASQTNLLSMNAAIEAAHAGEAGKGFAVVADEIRKLAESSSEQSKTIGTVLKKIKESIDKITRSTDNVLNKFEAIDSSVKTVADQEENIRNAMEEQGAGSKQILDSISQLNEITQQVKSGSEEMLGGSREVIQESKNLEIVTQEISGGLSEMATGAEQINVAINRVNELTGQNRDSIDTLVREVSRFKIE
jgi:methyl-accepting chemotaxis protein